MSSIYVLEPPTKGKVVLSTSVGDIDIELWPKEAPKAVRNFVQLCLDGYYNGTLFHRIVKGFMAQAGDRSKTGTGGESIYGAPFADEFHSRLKFTHRGLVACANPGIPNSNNSQFFITLDRSEWLDKKNTIFGKVTGDTIYNVLKLGECETDKDDRPMQPPVIYSVEILWNPFEDMVPLSVYEQKKEEERKEDEEKKDIPKPKKKLNLLSFGEEAEEEFQELKASEQEVKIKSSHDVLQDPRLLRGEDREDQEKDEAEKKRREGLRDAVKKALRKDDPPGKDGKSKEKDRKDKEKGGSDSTSGRGSESEPEEEGEEDFESRMRRKVLEKRKQLGVPEKPKKVSRKEQAKDADLKRGEQSEEEGKDAEASEEERDPENKRQRQERLQVKPSGGLGSEARSSLKDSSNVDASLMSPLEQQRAKYKQRKRERGEREKQALEMMETFRKKLKEGKKGAEDQTEVANEEDDSDWFKHKLKFSDETSKKDSMARNEDPNEYVLVDPLLEKGKEKFNKQQAKMKKRNREWAGRSLD